MGRFAARTKVKTRESRDEIERTLQRYGGTAFMYGQTADRAVIAFELQNRRIKFELPLPNVGSDEFTKTQARGLERSPEEAYKAWEQACRQRWRALALAIKAKLEAVAAEITTFEEEFLAHIVLPNGQTVGENILPHVTEAYESKKMPPLLGRF